jgi:hypothetical protein
MDTVTLLSAFLGLSVASNVLSFIIQRTHKAELQQVLDDHEDQKIYAEISNVRDSLASDISEIYRQIDNRATETEKSIAAIATRLDEYDAELSVPEYLGDFEPETTNNPYVNKISKVKISKHKKRG